MVRLPRIMRVFGAVHHGAAREEDSILGSVRVRLQPSWLEAGDGEGESGVCSEVVWREREVAFLERRGHGGGEWQRRVEGEITVRPGRDAESDSRGYTVRVPQRERHGAVPGPVCRLLELEGAAGGGGREADSRARVQVYVDVRVLVLLAKVPQVPAQTAE